MDVDKKLYPFKSNYFQIGKHKMHYLDEGAGAPVVMLHGNPTWSFLFRSLVSELSGKYRCIVPDHIGHGLSDKPSASDYSYTLEERANNIDSLLQHLKIENGITLILHDWGGAIGMTYASRYREKIKRIVLFNTAAFRLPPNKPFPWTIALCKNGLIGSFLVQGLNLFCQGAKIFCVKNRLDPDIAKMYLAPYDSWKNRVSIRNFIKDIPTKPQDRSYYTLVDTESKLNFFKDTPTLICWGGKDFIFDDAFLKRWQTFLPKATIRKFNNAGHYLLEDSGEEICKEVKNFLKETD